MQPSSFTLERWQKVIVYILVVFIIVSGSIASFRFLTRPSSPLPSDIERQLPFSPLIIPKNNKLYTTTGYSIDTGEDGGQFLNFTIKSEDGISVKVLEQEQPPAFTEIPDYKDRVLTNRFKQYDKVQTSTGEVYLGRLAVPKDAQVGIIIDKGLLIFLTPKKELTKVQWRSIVNQLEILNTN